MLQRLVIIALLGGTCALVSACVEDQPKAIAPAPTAAPAALTQQSERHPELTLTGKTLYVSPIDAGEHAINKDHARMLYAFVASLFRRQGFVVVANQKDAYTTVYVGSGKYWPTASGQKLIADEIEQTVVENGKIVSHEKLTLGEPHNWVGITVSINSYGERAKPYYAMKIYSAWPLDNFWNEVMTTFHDKLEAEHIAPPLENVAMKGPPGCMPRLGIEHRFEVDTKSHNGFYKVVEVEKGSPGQKAGLKVGDVFDAIDSISYGDWLQNSETSEIYTKMIPVPIKYSRNGRTFRGTIQARVLCE